MASTHILQVELRGRNHTFLSSEQMQVSLLVNQLRVNFTKGEWVTLRAFAVSSVGTSDPVSADVIVPCELLYVIYVVHAGLIGAWVVSVYVGIVHKYILWWYGPCVAFSIHVVYCPLQSLPTSLLPPLNLAPLTSQCAVQECSSTWLNLMIRPYKCGSLLTAPPTLPTRLQGMAVSSTSWDCRPAQSTPSKSLCPTYLEQCGSTPQSGLSLVS